MCVCVCVGVQYTPNMSAHTNKKRNTQETPNKQVYRRSENEEMRPSVGNKIENEQKKNQTLNSSANLRTELLINCGKTFQRTFNHILDKLNNITRQHNGFSSNSSEHNTPASLVFFFSSCNSVWPGSSPIHVLFLHQGIP